VDDELSRYLTARRLRAAHLQREQGVDVAPVPTLREMRLAEHLAPLGVDPRFAGARCAGLASWDYELPHLEAEDEPREIRRQRFADAAFACGRCPARSPCAELAAALGPHCWGVWAGTAYAAGRVLSLRGAEQPDPGDRPAA
jgi:hypothetical protein